jgi:hypothetical protein
MCAAYPACSLSDEMVLGLRSYLAFLAYQMFCLRTTTEQVAKPSKSMEKKSSEIRLFLLDKYDEFGTPHR